MNEKERMKGLAGLMTENDFPKFEQIRRKLTKRYEMCGLINRNQFQVFYTSDEWILFSFTRSGDMDILSASDAYKSYIGVGKKISSMDYLTATLDAIKTKKRI